jgi:hypothetical protein
MIRVEKCAVRFLSAQKALKHFCQQQWIDFCQIILAGLKGGSRPLGGDKMPKRKVKISLVVAKPEARTTCSPVCVYDLLP